MSSKFAQVKVVPEVSRKLPSFIDGFMQYTDGKGSSALYRKWAAIFTVSAAMERKVWLRTVKGNLYVNKFILLVGEAGVGKSLCTNTVYDLLRELHTPETPLFLAPTSVTKASLIDALAHAERRIIRPMEVPAINSFNSLTIIPNEFGVFLPSWEGDFMSTLTDLWDCGHYRETRRTSKLDIDIPRSQLNLFSATTPAHLTNLLPEGAWEQGFMSRIMLIYSSEVEHTDLFAHFDMDTELHKALHHDLLEIYKMWGGLTITEETKVAINEWAKGGGKPLPDHPKLSGYCARRVAHLLKLCMTACVAKSSSKEITLDHFAEALDWLVEAETFMPDIFKSMKTGGDGRAIEECWHFVYKLHIKENQPIAEARIINFLQERVPAHNVMRILDVMERAQLLTKKLIGSGHGYEPKSKKAS